MLEQNFLAYLTRPQYNNLSKINDLTNMYNLNDMIWNKIYDDNYKFVKDIFTTKNYKIQRITLLNYNHYFILEQKADEHKPLLFWVNTLGRNFPEPNNIEKIITYNMDPNDLQVVSLNNKKYICIHVGNMLFDYAKFTNKSMSKKTEEEFYDDFKNYLNGDDDRLKFKYSIFNDTIIIYRVKKV